MSMKIILLALTAIALLAITGCATKVGTGVDHGEHPGDLQHGDTMQK